ncbi:putative DNA primase/helicase [Crenobacter luteus]|uniref:DUF7146 domain-containing protein n=1 Tax=Crenobacter luteus TaxID=1452487 RepID=UPI00104F9737|nr:toprim domain-containing protein [Crenobacter luteus]TCP10889.1 putative DNA primase/helicase [Crenobacter luteus]
MSRIDLQHVRREAFGRWPDILTALGIPAEVFRHRRNQPCPCCGGTDRFQFIDKGTGRFVCRGLDRLGGDGFALAMHWLGADFKAALRAVAGVLGLAEGATPTAAAPRAPAPASVPATRDDAAKLERLWREAAPLHRDDPAARYLTGRGLLLNVYPAALRCHPALPYWCEVDGRPVHLGDFPALLAELTAPDGSRAGLHRIYLTPDGRKARPLHPASGAALDCKKLLTAHEGASKGAAVRLFEPEGGALALAEGIETALAVRLGSGLPCWAGVSAGGLERLELPETVADVHIMADHDESGTGQQAAERLAHRLLGEARRVRIHTPSAPGDWLDVYQSRQEAAA